MNAWYRKKGSVLWGGDRVMVVNSCEYRVSHIDI